MEARRKEDRALVRRAASRLLNLVSGPPRVREPACIPLMGLGAEQAGGHPWKPREESESGASVRVMDGKAPWWVGLIT